MLTSYFFLIHCLYACVKFNDENSRGYVLQVYFLKSKIHFYNYKTIQYIVSIRIEWMRCSAHSQERWVMVWSCQCMIESYTGRSSHCQLKSSSDHHNHWRDANCLKFSPLINFLLHYWFLIEEILFISVLC